MNIISKKHLIFALVVLVAIGLGWSLGANYYRPEPATPVNSGIPATTSPASAASSTAASLVIATGTPGIAGRGLARDLLKVSSPQPYAKVKSPLAITGQAVGYWFFEAQFPVKIFDADNKQLGQTPAQAQGEWTTDNFVPFSATLTFSTSTTAAGYLVLEKDNPSGLPANANQLIIPVSF